MVDRRPLIGFRARDRAEPTARPGLNISHRVTYSRKKIHSLGRAKNAASVVWLSLKEQAVSSPNRPSGASVERQLESLLGWKVAHSLSTRNSATRSTILSHQCSRQWSWSRASCGLDAYFHRQEASTRPTSRVLAIAWATVPFQPRSQALVQQMKSLLITARRDWRVFNFLQCPHSLPRRQLSRKAESIQSLLQEHA